MRELTALLFLAIAAVLGCIGGIIWLVSTRQISSIDGLFLLLVFFWLGAVFSYISQYIRKTLNGMRTTKGAGASKLSTSPSVAIRSAEPSVADEVEKPGEVVVYR
jgi:hypothetical protein